MYEFYIFCSYHVWIHIFLAEAASAREPRVHTASMQREPRARSASREGKAQAPDQATPDLCRSDPIHLNLNLDI